MLLLSYSYHSNDLLILPPLFHTFMKIAPIEFLKLFGQFYIYSNLCHPDFFTPRLGEHFRWSGIPDRLERCPPTYVGSLVTLHLNDPFTWVSSVTVIQWFLTSRMISMDFHFSVTFWLHQCWRQIISVTFEMLETYRSNI